VVFIVFSSLCRVASRLRLKLVQTLPGAETKYPAFVVLGVALTGLDWHSTNRVFCGTFTLAGTMSFVLVVPVDHVRPTTETHHEVEKGREKQK
jgi:hypothetical protein